MKIVKITKKRNSTQCEGKYDIFIRKHTTIKRNLENDPQERGSSVFGENGKN